VVNNILPRANIKLDHNKHHYLHTALSIMNTLGPDLPRLFTADGKSIPTLDEYTGPSSSMSKFAIFVYIMVLVTILIFVGSIITMAVINLRSDSLDKFTQRRAPHSRDVYHAVN
jgi:hypothetical protein